MWVDSPALAAMARLCGLWDLTEVVFTTKSLAMPLFFNELLIISVFLVNLQLFLLTNANCGPIFQTAATEIFVHGFLVFLQVR